MVREVFLSYASQDVSLAWLVYNALERRNISAWFAPVDVPGGEHFGEEIARIVPTCRVFLLLWSRSAASTEHVKREIAIATEAKTKPHLFPVRLDDTPREPYYLKLENWVPMNTLGPERVAESVEERLKVENTPGPLGRMYHELQEHKSDFPRHLEAVRQVARFVALVQIASYIQVGKRSDELNRRIDQFLTLSSLFSDLDVAKRILRSLQEGDGPLSKGFHGFLKLLPSGLPGADDFDKSDDAADEFDTKHLHLLFYVENSGDFRSTALSAEELRNFCPGIRDFMRQALTKEWSSVCRPVIVVDGHGGGEMETSTDLVGFSQEELGNAKVRLNLPWGNLDLTPFFVPLRSGVDGALEIGLLRGQNGTARFRAITTQAGGFTERPPIVLPWSRVEIHRTLPRIVYIGEEHHVQLNLVNRSSAAVQIPRIDERLPENLTPASGENTVCVAKDVMLGAGESRDLGYEIRGANLPGAARSFAADGKVSYLFQGEESSSAIQGDRDVIVQVLPPPRLIVTRRLLDRQSQPIEAHVALDTELTVEVQVRSAGAALPRVHLEEEISGAEIVAGSKVLHSGSIGRMDKQPPILASYRMRVIGPDAVTIRTQPGDVDEHVTVDETASRIVVDDLSPPRLGLRWQEVVRQAPDRLDADLRIENTGGTSAYELEISTRSPSGVAVSVTSPHALQRLEAGTVGSSHVQITFRGIPDGSVRLLVSYRSVRGDTFSAVIDLALGRVVDKNIAALPFVGRAHVREEIKAAITNRNIVLLNLYGERGVGKKRVLLAEIDRLRQLEGRTVTFYEFDCGIATSFAEAIAMLLERVIDEGSPGQARGSANARKAFMAHVGMEEQQYKGYTTHLESLLDRAEKSGVGTWRSMALLLSKMAESSRSRPLILMLRRVSRFGTAELEALTLLRQFLQPPNDVLIVTTSVEPLNIEAMDAQVKMEPFSDDDCRSLIDSVFLLPKSALPLQQALIEKSEHLPANLVSLLRQLVDDANGLLDFGNPTGVRIRDASGFRNLPTSLLASERKAAQSSDIPLPLLATLAAFREPFSVSRVQAVLHKLQEDRPEESIRQYLLEGKKRCWLQDLGNKLVILSATVRAALSEAVPVDLLERVHQALFEICEEEQSPVEYRFQHLVAAPGPFIARSGGKLMEGLRALVGKGKFSQVHTVLERIRREEIKLNADIDFELGGIEQELALEETGDLDPRKIETLLGALRVVPVRSRRADLKMRLSLLESRWYSQRRQEYDKAAAVAESARPYWFARVLSKHDPHLEFDFYLNLWAIYYRLLDETRFARIDRWIWKRLAKRESGRYDSYAIAQFLGLFLEFQREFPTPVARAEHFPLKWVQIQNEQRPLRDNRIEVLTRTEHIRASFLDEFLTDPDKLNADNILVLGRLYFDLGAALWAEVMTRSLLNSSPTAPAETQVRDAESYLVRAESLFAEAGFLIDLAICRAKIGGTYVDKIRLAEQKGDAQQAGDLYPFAAKWLQLASADFENVHDMARAAEVCESYAEVTRKWANREQDRLDEAIRAYERLIEFPTIQAHPERLNGFRLTLVELYDDAGRVDLATSMLDKMDVTNATIVQRRAVLHAESLLKGSLSVSPHNLDDLTRDLESLRSSAPPRTDTVHGRHRLARSEAPAVIAWHIAKFQAEQLRGEMALQVLRDYRKELAASQPLFAELRSNLPSLLSTLWQMEGSADDRMTQDFSNLMLPLITPEFRAALEQMLETVWKWEENRAGEIHLAAADMTLVLCEWCLDHGYEAESERVAARFVFQRLRARNVWTARTVARILARSLTMMLRVDSARRNESVLQEELADLLDELSRKQLDTFSFSVLLLLMEMLLEMHRVTQERWYFDVIVKLSDQLRPLQDSGENDFEDVVHLISLYLQLPSYITEAIELMEKQCQRLLDGNDYDRLAQYLSFLSDLLGSMVREDEAPASGADGEEAEVASMNPQVTGGQGQTNAIRKVATELVGRIIAELRKQRLKGESQRHLLYNAAKLLSDRETADLQAAIYAKLYDLAEEVDGSSVWALFAAWEKGAAESGTLSLQDSIAMTTYSNCHDESIEGRFKGNPRNYLINARARNYQIERLMRGSARQHELVAAYVELEIQRLLFLRHFTATIHEYLEQEDDFERMASVTFLYGYLFSRTEGLPFWQKVQRIGNHTEEIDRELLGFCELWSRSSGQAVVSDILPQLRMGVSSGVQHFLVENRSRGGAIVAQLAERIGPFSLDEILGEVQARVEGRERSVNFGAILGLWIGARQSGQPPGQSLPDDGGAFLNRDPQLLIEAQVTNGWQLLTKGKPWLAELLFRSALGLCTRDEPQRPTILHGLCQSLVEQGRSDEASALASKQPSGTRVL